MSFGYMMWIPVIYQKMPFGYVMWKVYAAEPRPPTGRHWIGRASGAGVVALVGLITLAFLKVSMYSQTFTSQFAFICPWQHQTAVGSDLFQNWKEQNMRFEVAWINSGSVFSFWWALKMIL